jgi:hypothetical protein
MSKPKKEKIFRTVGGFNIQVIGDTLRWRGKDVCHLLESPYLEDFLDWLVHADVVMQNTPDLKGLRSTKPWQTIPVASYSGPDQS